jgi:hypothetical protein
MNRAWLTVFLTIGSLICYSQQTLFAELQGEELRYAVVKEYKPKYVELFSKARNILYREIYNVEDTVHTFYLDHKVYLPPYEKHPIQYLSREGAPDGIRTDHIFPLSKGADESNGNAYSDMHNLLPIRWELGELKADAPYKDIVDAQSNLWLFNDKKLKNKNTLSESDLTQYYEIALDQSKRAIGFEPRDEVKGDIARSIFYFYTMYRKEAQSADAKYFDLMKADLCKWHLSDPVDKTEINKNALIAAYQDSKENPFIIDMTLANRLYCSQTTEVAYDPESSATQQVKSFRLNAEFDPQVKVLTNTNKGIFKLDISNILPRDYQLEIFDVTGKLIYSLAEKLDYFNTINMWNVKSGLYFIHLKDLTTGKKFSDVFKVIRS